jgi:hypothetical protein
MTAPTAFGLHHMAPSEPTYHDVEGNRRQQSRQQQKHSRSLSPAGPRRGTLEATPHDLYHRVRQNADPHQQFAAQAYSQRYSRQEKVHRKEMTESLLMFSDAFDTASALTGWSEQELIQKKKKKFEKKPSKKKKHREPRILNMPGALKRNNSSSELPAVGERKRYYRGGDGPSGTMSRGITQKRTISQPKSDSPKRHWNIVPTFSKSSEMDSTQSSTDVADDVSNPAVRRWIKSKQRRKKKEDFPLLSSKSAEKASFPKKDAPGPVARRPSPQIFDSAIYQYDVSGEQVHIASEEKQSQSPITRSSSSKSPSRRPTSSRSPSNRSNSSRSPARQTDIAASSATKQDSRNVFPNSDDAWMQAGSDLNVTPDIDTSYHLSQYGGTAMNHSPDLPDDRSPTSVASRQAYKKRARDKSSDGSGKPRSILRNSPRQQATRRDGTYPLNRTRSSYDEDDNDFPQRMQTRFSDNVEQRTYYMDEDKYMSESDNEFSFVNDYSDQGAFPVQERSQGGLDHFDNGHGDFFSRSNQDRAQAVEPNFFEKKEESYSEEPTRLGAVPRYHSDTTGTDINPILSLGSDDSTRISKDPPTEGIGFTDRDGKALSPIRPTKKSESKLDPVDRARNIQPIPRPQARYARQPEPVPAAHKISPVRSIPQAYDIESPPRDYSDIYETSAVPTSASLEGGEKWIADEAYDIADDEFEDHESDLAFMQVVAAVVIQTTFRRYLAVLTFERMVKEHFKSIAGPDIMDQLVPATQRHMPIAQSPKLQPQHIEAVQVTRRQAPFPVSRAPPINPARQLIQKSAPSESKPYRPDPPPQNQRERVQLYIKCAIKIQRIFRGWWIRDSLHVDHYCATLIQQAARGFLSRNSYYYDMYRIILAQAHLRMMMAREMAAERFASIVIMQAHIRGYLVRMHTRRDMSDGTLHLAEYAAATKVQALFRAFSLQEKYLNILADILIVQSVARRWIAVTFEIPHLASGRVADTERMVEDDLNQQQQQVVEPCNEELPSRSMGEMSHNEVIGMWRKKKKYNPNSPVRPQLVPNSATNHDHVEKATEAAHPIVITPSDKVSAVEDRRTATGLNVRPVVISPSDEASEPRPAKRRPVVISPNTGEALYGAAPKVKDEPKGDNPNYLNSGKRGGVASRYTPEDRGAPYGQKQAQQSAKSQNVRRHPVVAALDEPSATHSASWEEESRKGHGPVSYGAGPKAVVAQPGQGVVLSRKPYKSTVVTTREALMNPQSFDSPCRASSSSPAPKNPAVAAREALMNPLSFDSSTKAPSSPASQTPPQLSTPKRKPPKNSAAAFWEQKTASQPKPMFPPKGGLYYSSR